MCGLVSVLLIAMRTEIQENGCFQAHFVYSKFLVNVLSNICELTRAYGAPPLAPRIYGFSCILCAATSQTFFRLIKT